ncbi:gliding motility-associated C-terminal domain-containing protein [Fulvivirga sp. 29W222]|uniref:Gliding motility-associated C-terminal domain-containing protein n=1 Tax=Fulvivirga marina TaxID=2494733 RepID=A0A937FYR0_9BACT|nr:gliding motility-associated C-terminal domain-containing protein [Fulvivirga marina]MBL6447267.1 gliding motility-associated C-terminal domain-containing protein [Fulvivirga marina]
MRKILLVSILILICKVSSFASHIVGGEFELVYLSGNNYRLNLIIYFDEINGAPGAKYSPLPLAWIYRKSDNAVMMQDIQLSLFSEEPVAYTVPSCANDAIVKTTKLVFSKVITLTPESYNHPDGYYIVWQRCCRNYNIVNVVSENPDAGGVGSGLTFYLEIPPLVKDGKRFINNTPQLFPPLSDYACVNRGYYADFKGVDADGDSLVYSLVTPLNTPSAVPHPQPPSTAPYPQVIWEATYSLNNIVHGNPNLTITDDGLLRVTPTEEGIFVFAVKCEEYRDGEKIGEVRRDFQMVVVDCPPGGSEPDVNIELEDGSTYNEGDVLHFLADDDKCVKFTVEDEKGGRVNLKLDPIGYDEENFEIQILSTSPSGDRLTAQVCFTDCPPDKDLPFEVSFIGLDDTCPQPLQDTVKLTVKITPPDNDLPVLKHKEDDGSYSVASQRLVTVNEKAGGVKIVQLLGQDANSDLMDFMLEPVGFELADYGMSVIDKANSAGVREVWLQWNYDCQQVSFDGKTSFEIKVYLEDEDDCQYEEPVLVTLFLNVNLPDNSLPNVYSEKLGSSNQYVKVTAQLDETVTFDVRGTDEDGDLAFIEAVPANFSFSDYNITYNRVQGQGKPSATQLNSTFSWTLACKKFKLVEQDSFRVYFMMEDFDKCEITNRDTLTVDFLLSPPPNSDPLLTVQSANKFPIVNDTIHIIIDENISLRLTGRDFEGDSITLYLVDDQPERLGYDFESKTGMGTVAADFVWSPECHVLEGQPEVFVPLTFAVQDNHCTQPRSKQYSLVVHIEDIDDKSEQFIPPNIFTPNGDDLNTYFGMYRVNNQTGVEENILPIDNCAGQFEKVVVYNRWGREVYSSTDRYFKWYGDDVSSGVYFYYIEYTNRGYRGSFTVRF